MGGLTWVSPLGAWLCRAGQGRVCGQRGGPLFVWVCHFGTRASHTAVVRCMWHVWVGGKAPESLGSLFLDKLGLAPAIWGAEACCMQCASFPSGSNRAALVFPMLGLLYKLLNVR